MPLVFVGNQIGAAGSTLTVDPATGAIVASPVAGQNFTLSAGKFSLGAALSQIVPGSTSLSFRNNADSADNLLLTEAGNATLRGTLTFSAVTSQVIPGVTSLAFRNNANTLNNVLIADLGDVTIRGALALGNSLVGTNGAYLFTNHTYRDPGNPIATWYNRTTFGITADNIQTLRAGEIDAATSSSDVKSYLGEIDSFTSYMSHHGPGLLYLAEGIQGTVVTSPGSTGAITYAIGGIGQAISYGSGTIAKGFGLFGQVEIAATGGAADGTISYAYPVTGQLLVDSLAATPGLIAHGYTLYAQQPVVRHNGKIGTAVGVEIDNHSMSGGTLSYGLRVQAQTQTGGAMTVYSASFQGGMVQIQPTMTVASAKAAVWNGISVPPTTLTLSGSIGTVTDSGVNLVAIAAPSIVTAAAVRFSASLAIAGPPTIGSGGGSLGAGYTLWSQAGTNRFDGMVLTAASGLGGAGIRISPGTAPAAPVDGDIWITAAGIFARLNGATKAILTS